MKLSALLVSAAVIAAVPAWATSTTTPPAATTTTSPSGPSTTTTSSGTMATPAAPGSGGTVTTTAPSVTTTKMPSVTTTTTSVTPVALNVASLRKADDKNLKWGDFTVSQLDDMNVVDAADKKIGEVDDVLVDTTGKIVAVVVEMGGFLGMGERHYVVDLGKLTPKDKVLQTSMTKEQLEQQPEWKK